MTTNQTIDGVPRALLERLLTLAAMSASAPYRELRALLDAPVNPLSEIEVLRAAVKELEALRDARVDAKLARPQGEPVAMMNDGREGEPCIWFSRPPNGTKLYADQPAPVAFDFELAAQKLASCMDYPWDHMPEQGRAAMREHAKAIINAAQSSSVAVALSADELRFLEVIAMNPGAKLNGGEAFDDEGNSLWGRLEKLGLIECVGSYKWKLAFNAVEMGIKAFVGRPPAPAVLPSNWKNLLLEDMCKRCNLEGDEDNHLEGDDTQVGVEFARDWIAERINQVIAEQPAPVAPTPINYGALDPLAVCRGRMCDCNQGRLPCRCKT